MFERMFGPKYTLKDALLILEKGLRSGEISLDSDEEIDRTVIVEGARFQMCSRVRVFAPLVSYANVRWSGRDEPGTE